MPKRMPQTVAGWEAQGFRPVAGGEGHRKGWEWGEAFDTRNIHYANGNSASFNAGVRAYAVSRRRQVRGYFMR